MKKVLAAGLLALVLAGCGNTSKGTVDADHDGRYHPCGLVTEDGVTDHLAEYEERCGLVPVSGVDNPIDCGVGFHLVDDICLMD